MKHLTIHTDGACRGNPGPGGWGALLQFADNIKELSGATTLTTNNKMELMAAIKALQALKYQCTIDLYIDSKYVKQGINDWIKNWKKNGWKNAQKKPVKNKELWQELDGEVNKHIITWHWVKGHSGDPGNERADELANLAIDKMQGRA